MNDNAPVRDRLLAIATRLFIEHGYEGTPVSRIVREAGVTMPALYYHFGSKSDLLREVIAQRGSWFRSDITLDATRPFAETCQAMVQQAIEHISEVRDGLRLRLLLGFEAGPDADTLRDLVKEQRKRTVAKLAELFGRILPEATQRRLFWLAEVYLSGAQALALETIGANGADQLEAKAELLVATLIRVSVQAENELPFFVKGRGS